MTYYYYQIEGGNETWKPANTSNLQIIEKAMFCTILSLDAPLQDDADKETLAGVRYSGPLYFDLDDAESPASTAKYAKKLADRLFELDVLPNHIEIFASGGKGFHLTIPQAVFMSKPPKTGMTYLPAIYKEVAYKLAVESMDFRVYTARKGRMFRRANIKRPNDLYKVQISYDELCSLAEMEDSASAEAAYKLMCSAPRELTPVDVTDIKPANGLMSEFDMAKSKITKSSKGRKKKPVVMPKDLPSFTALLDGRGIKPGTGFQQLAMQAAITAHARNMSREDFLSAAQGLCENHDSDGFRYNTASKRRVELGRMWDYTEDNPCYEFAPSAVTALLAHRAPDLKGIPASDADVEESIAEGESDGSDSEYGHANIYFTSEGAYGLTESGSKRLTSITFDNVTELVSTEDNKVSVVEADVYVGGRRVATGTSFELDAFNSVSGINKTFMRHGQSFSGSDAQARGVYMRMIQKARKANRRMYVSNREGLDIVKIPGHDSEIARKGFLIWSDNRGVAVPPQAAEEHVQMRFVGYPDPQGLFQTDIEDAPNLVEWLKTGENKEDMRKFLHNLLNCQSASHVGKLLGWSVAAYWRMLFHEKYDKFPLLHINGAAGQGKSLRKGTLVIRADGTRDAIENIKVGDKLLGPDGSIRNVLALGRGRETMYKVSPVKGEPYYVNESHILSLKRSYAGTCRLSDGRYVGNDVDILNVNVKVWSESSAATQKLFKGYRAGQVEFHREQKALVVPPYILGIWIGDGNSDSAVITKSRDTKMVEAWNNYGRELGMKVTETVLSPKCSRFRLSEQTHVSYNEVANRLRTIGVLNNKHIPDEYLYSTAENRLQLLAGLMDSDGNQSYGGYDWVGKDKKIADAVIFLARSLGFAAYLKESVKTIKSIGFTGDYWRVHISGDCERIPCKDKPAPVRKQIKNVLVSGLTFKKLDEEDYYGVCLDGDKLFLLGDFTVTHNTETTKLFCNLHYYNSEPKMLTPTSTIFAITHSITGSCSIPIVLDEFKPSEMNPNLYDKFKLMLRDAYNCRTVERGGGTRENADYRSVHRSQLAAPIIFISEAAESESALMERVVLLTQIKPPTIQMSENLENFLAASERKELLGVLGKYIAASIIKRATLESFVEEFTPIYNSTRKELMLSKDDVDLSPEMLAKKSGAKERTVFNYAVVRFGLQKISNLIRGVYGEEFDTIFAEMNANVCSSVDDIQAQTVPEWLKVLNTFTDMAYTDPESQSFLIKGKDYAQITYAGVDCMEFNLRSCYHKYRQYQAASRSKSLFPGESAFIFAMSNTPALLARGRSVELDVPGGSFIFNLQELRANGYLAP